jgi:hypothetical protein
MLLLLNIAFLSNKRKRVADKTDSEAGEAKRRREERACRALNIENYK